MSLSSAVKIKKQKITSFLLGLITLSVIIWLIAWFIFHFITIPFNITFLTYILVFFCIINAAFFIIFLRINNAPNNIFIKNFLLLFLFKFSVYFITIITVLLIFKSEAIKIAITAMILYVVFTIYELPWMLSIAKRKK